MKAKKKAADAGAPAWMATFADLATLLLTFFILMLSFAEMDVIKFKDALGSLNEALGGTKSGSGLFQGSDSAVSVTNSAPPTAFVISGIAPSQVNKFLTSELKETVKEQKLDDGVEVETTKRGIVMRVTGRIFFNPGTADLVAGAQPLLDKIVSVINKYPKQVAVEGHTDNIPISSTKFRNNWELSTARAYAALEYIMETKGIDITRIHIGGFGDVRPIASNATPEGRSKNRRVEFVFYDE
ncbi:MAG: OmpA family protein [Nitrospira sp.]|nr:OmpA family protein [Nitrospira sp.]